MHHLLGVVIITLNKPIRDILILCNSSLSLRSRSVFLWLGSRSTALRQVLYVGAGSNVVGFEKIKYQLLHTMVALG